ncbi:MAG: YvrJ family protein [Clostridiaceae bacterium]
MELNELAAIIGNVGFPVAIAAYVLIRLEKTIMGLTSSINKLNTIISTKLGYVIDDENDDKIHKIQ